MYQLTLEAVRWSSILLQLIAAGVALRLVVVTGRRMAWMLISSGLVLMTALRLLPLLPALSGVAPAAPDPVPETVRLLISVLLLLGLVRVGPYFEEHEIASERLRKEHDRARQYLDVAGSMLVGLDLQGRVTLLNQAACRVLGVSERDVLGSDWFDRFVAASRRERARWRFEELLDGHQTDRDYSEYPVLNAGDEERTIAWRHSLVRDEAGGVSGILSSGDDITEQLSAEKELRFQSMLLDSATDSIIVHDVDGRLAYVNQAAAEARGYATREEMLELPPFGWIGIPTERRDAIMQIISGEGSHIWESVNLRKDGETFPVEVHARALFSADRKLVVSVIRDISERKEAEELIRRMAFYDPLTGLANRTLFGDRLGIAIAQAHRSGEGLAVMFLDVDHFKSINDTLGHDVGDSLLCGIAGRLRGLVREGDTVARLGGDEFILLLPDVDTEAGAGAVAVKVLEALQPPFDLGAHEIHATASIGIALYGRPADTAESLLRCADTAMYRAKEGGRNAWRTYDPSMDATALERFSLKNDLRRVLDRNELAVHYQPLVRVSDGRVTGVEALLRWHHPERGMISPADFIPLAEETGLIVPIGEWVLREACAQACKWRDGGFTGMRVAVNLSARQFFQGDLLETVTSVLESTGLEPTLLELEITESIAMQNADYMLETFSRLRDMGVRIAIDDFGTGYSSLDRLKRFPIHTLKVAQPFMDGVCENEESAAIATTIIVLAQSLKLNVVAEGVETESQLAFLREQGCNELQGYLFCKPLPAEQLTRLLRRGGLGLFSDPGAERLA
jgi:diguanylate cyclase (GGDEF)-like protein/PAS domain S-box-containing protein